MLATIVGSANGRSINALTMPLPGKSSRTSTQAIRVPITTLISATITETNTVTRSEASATGEVTASQKPAQPSSKALTVSAASGNSTMMLSHSTAVAMPSGPTEPVTRSHDQFGPREPAAAGLLSSVVAPEPGAGSVPALLLLSVTVSSIACVPDHPSTWWRCRR
jgi:hypothetical protein